MGTVPYEIMQQMDLLACYKKTAINAVTTKTNLWDLIHATDNQPYENTVQGASISNLDTVSGQFQVGSSVFASWFSLHTTYFRSVLNLASMDAWIASQGWRVHQYFNQLSKDYNSVYLTPSNAFPRDDFSLGTHAKTSDVFAVGIAVDATQAGGGKIAAVVPGGTTIGGSNYVLTATLTKSDGTGLTGQVVTIPSSSTAGTTKIFGEQLLAGNANAGQAVVLVAATAQYIVGQTVLVQDSAAQEWGTVLSVATNTSITLTTSLINTYTTARTAKVTPLFYGITACTCSSTGTTGDNVNFQIAPDRVVSLTPTP